MEIEASIPSTFGRIKFRRVEPTGNGSYCAEGVFGHNWGSDEIWSIGQCPLHAPDAIREGRLYLPPEQRDAITDYLNDPPIVRSPQSLDLPHLRAILSADERFATKQINELKLGLLGAVHQGGEALTQMRELIQQILVADGNCLAVDDESPARPNVDAHQHSAGAVGGKR